MNLEKNFIIQSSPRRKQCIYSGTALAGNVFGMPPLELAAELLVGSICSDVSFSTHDGVIAVWLRAKCLWSFSKQNSWKAQRFPQLTIFQDIYSEPCEAVIKELSLRLSICLSYATKHGDVTGMPAHVRQQHRGGCDGVLASESVFLP